MKSVPFQSVLSPLCTLQRSLSLGGLAICHPGLHPINVHKQRVPAYTVQGAGLCPQEALLLVEKMTV